MGSMGDRAYGEGGLYYSESRGRWVAKWRGRKQYGRTKTEAARKLKAMRDGPAPGGQLRTVGQVIDWWTDTHLPHRLAAGTIAPKTVISYRGAIVHMRSLRRIPIEQLTSDDIDRIARRMAAGGNPLGGAYSASAIRGAITALRTALKAAAQKGLAPATRAAEHAERPSVPTTDVQLVTPDIAAAVLAQLDGHRYQRLILVTLHLGLRVSEALGMTWDHVDLDAGHVRIHQQLQRFDGTWMLRPTKTSADAHLALTIMATTALAEQRRAQVAERLAAGPAWQGHQAPGDLVWRRADGQPVHASTVSRAVKRACVYAGLPPMAIHAFARHGHATLLRLAGASLDDVREQLRHRQASTTTRYAHVVPEMRRTNATRIDQVLGG